MVHSRFGLGVAHLSFYLILYFRIGLSTLLGPSFAQLISNERPNWQTLYHAIKLKVKIDLCWIIYHQCPELCPQRRLAAADLAKHSVLMVELILFPSLDTFLLSIASPLFSSFPVNFSLKYGSWSNLPMYWKTLVILLFSLFSQFRLLQHFFICLPFNLLHPTILRT